MVLGSAKFGEAALFLTVVGSANFVFISFVPVILYFTHVEYIDSPEDIPWANVRSDVRTEEQKQRVREIPI